MHPQRAAGPGSTEVRRTAGADCSATRSTALYLLTVLMSQWPSLEIWFTMYSRKQEKKEYGFCLRKQNCTMCREWNSPWDWRNPFRMSALARPQNPTLLITCCVLRRGITAQLRQRTELRVLALLNESGQRYLIWFYHCSWPATYLLLNTVLYYIMSIKSCNKLFYCSLPTRSGGKVPRRIFLCLCRQNVIHRFSVWRNPMAHIWRTIEINLPCASAQTSVCRGGGNGN